MMKQLNLITTLILTSLSVVYFSSCESDDGPSLTGESMTYTLNAVSDPAVSGTVILAKRSDNAVVVTIQLTGTQAGNTHPAHIHNDNAATSGGIAIDLTSVDGSSGKSETVIQQLNDGTPVTYEQLLEFDGYVNVHLSASNLATLIAQGDIGQNALTGDMVEYELASVSDPAVSGKVTFEERENAEILATIMLDGTNSGDSHPAHIHNNSAAQGGGIAIDFTNVDGATGMSKTNITQLNNGTPISYDQLLEFNGYVNVHLSSANLGTLIAQGDIGQNALTGESKEYMLNSVSDPTISGKVTFSERVNGQTLAVIELDGTTDGGDHPAHIHNNSAAQGGGIAIDFTNVDGATGMSKTNISQLNNGTPIAYDELIEFNGYVNVHLSSSNLGTLIAQGDIGQNALTGESKEYMLNSVSDPTISGKVTFSERVNGQTLAVIELVGTSDGGDHPAHIHNNSAAQGGGIAIDFNNVSGATGMSKTNISQLNNGTPITYDELLVFNGYVNVHLSAANLATLIAQGNIGSNAN